MPGARSRHQLRKSRRVTRVLEQIIRQRGRSQSTDAITGQELTSRTLPRMVHWNGESTSCIFSRDDRCRTDTSKSSMENFGDECLNVSWLRNLFDARRKIVAWRARLQPASSTAVFRRTGRHRSSAILNKSRCGLRQGTSLPALAPHPHPRSKRTG